MLPAADCNSLETGQKRLQLIFKYRQNKIQFKNKSQSEVSSSTFRVVTYIMPKRYISRAQFNNLYASLNTHDLSKYNKDILQSSIQWIPSRKIHRFDQSTLLFISGWSSTMQEFVMNSPPSSCSSKRRRLVCQKKLTIPQNRFRYFSHVLVTVLTLHLLLV